MVSSWMQCETIELPRHVYWADAVDIIGVFFQKLDFVRHVRRGAARPGGQKLFCVVVMSMSILFLFFWWQERTNEIHLYWNYYKYFCLFVCLYVCSSYFINSLSKVHYQKVYTYIYPRIITIISWLQKKKDFYFSLFICHEYIFFSFSFNLFLFI